MAKRARYTGHRGPQISIEYQTDEGPKQLWVEAGHLLPDDVPASVRDDLLGSDDWTLVDQSTGPKNDKE